MKACLFFFRLVLVSTYFVPGDFKGELKSSFDERFAGNWHRLAMAKRGKEPMISAGDLQITYQPPDKVKVLRRVPDGSGCKDIVYQLKMATKQLFYYDDAGQRIYVIPQRVEENSFLFLSVEIEDDVALYLLGGRRLVVPDKVWQKFQALLPLLRFSKEDLRFPQKAEKCPLPDSKGKKIGPLTSGVSSKSTTR